MEKITIKTFKDIVDATNEENLDRFLVDLKNILKITHVCRKK